MREAKETKKMKTEEMGNKWGEMSEEMISGMTEWRNHHP